MTALGSDHAGFELKYKIIEYLKDMDIVFRDFGSFENEPNDYPIYARTVCEAILGGRCENGILICTTGIGISIAANRFKGIRAALCHDELTAAAARSHNDANILVMGARVVNTEMGLTIVKTFFDTKFSYVERHIRRIAMLDELC